MENWVNVIKKYNRPNNKKAFIQLLNTFIPMFILLYLSYYFLHRNYLITLLISILIAFFIDRSFIIFHDCGHQSFTSSKRMNDIIGMFSGVFTFSTYYAWTESHFLHHRDSSNLEVEPMIGGIETFTVEKYKKLSKLNKFKYNFYRNPFVLLLLGPTYVFLISSRFTNSHNSKKAKIGIYLTDIFYISIFYLAYNTIGLVNFLLWYGPPCLLGITFGVWLFYIQHQFPGSYWAKGKEKDFYKAAIDGSSFYDLPLWLHWLTGNIGYHHIHHLSPLIPNYNLKKAHYENKIFSDVKGFKLFESFKFIRLALYDEKLKKMVSFKEYENNTL